MKEGDRYISLKSDSTFEIVSFTKHFVQIKRESDKKNINVGIDRFNKLYKPIDKKCTNTIK